MDDPQGPGSQPTHHTTVADPHRWILQVLGIIAVTILAGYDLVTPDADIDREVYLIIGGISIGVRPETIVTAYTLWTGNTP